MQFFGYAISLGGLIYYKAGSDQLRSVFQTARNEWKAFSAKHSMLRTEMAVFSVLALACTLLGVLLPNFAPDYDIRGVLLSGAASVRLVT